MILSFLSRLTRPTLDKEDLRRRQFILNILSLGSILLAGVAVITLLIVKENILHHRGYYRGVPPAYISIIFLLFLAIYVLSRGGFIYGAAAIFLSLYFGVATFMIISWGVDIPEGLLMYVLLIVMAGVLVGTRLTLILTTIIALTFFTVFYTQAHQLFMVHSYWRSDRPGYDDVFVTIATFAIIALVSWLYSREIEKSLQRAQQSEGALRQERDLLEGKVQERTEELKRAQLEKMMNLYRLADIGKLASGVFHDLATPLNVVSLNLERLRDERMSGQMAEVKAAINRARRGVQSMERYIQAARWQIQQHEQLERFSVAEEIRRVVQLLQSKAEVSRVKIRSQISERVTLYGNPLKFNQVIMNVVANAIDAYEGDQQLKPGKKLVSITGTMNEQALTIRVQDWGQGIPLEIHQKIFEPFFTTKATKGTGIGLSIAKQIIEKDFQGRLEVQSEVGIGTIFTIDINF